MQRSSRGLILLLICSTFCATPITAAAQATRALAGFSGERLDRIDELMQERIDAQWFPGAVTLVARNGRIVHLEARCGPMPYFASCR
jgi:CubicO group peptidase (beta-lactamase class C family)